MLNCTWRGGMFNTVMFNTFRYGLIPVVLFCGVIIAASIDAHLTNFSQKSNWSQTTVTVVESQDPGDVAAQMRGTPNNFPDPHGTVRYRVDGKSYTWHGRGRDIGLTAMHPGEEISVYYNPENPEQINTLVLLGAGTGAVILLVALAFVGFYLWFFWLRGLLRGSGSGSDSGSGPGASGGAAPPRQSQTMRSNSVAGSSFGRRV